MSTGRASKAEFVTIDKKSSEWLAHVYLFKDEIHQSFSRRSDLLLFRDVFEEQHISLELLNHANYVEFWRVVSQSNYLMDYLINLLSQKNIRLYEEINRPMRKESFFYYSKFLSDGGMCMRAVAESIDPIALVNNFPSGYSDLIERVIAYAEKKQIDKASCYLMRSLPYEGNVVDDAAAWYFDFCNACLCDPSNCTIPEYVDPNYEEALMAYNLKITLTKTYKNDNTSEGDVNALGVIDEEYEDNSHPCRNQEDYKDSRFRFVSEDVLASLPDPENIELRLYQEELVCAAERGINTIICAPTGSGKTVVAAHIIMDHLKKLRAENKVGRVALLVPTVPLVEQQNTMLNKFMRKSYWIEGVSGSETIIDNGRAPFVLASDVTVFTPQIFINLLKSVRKDDRLYFTDFTMFIFDECHHCDKDHPYNVLMRMVHDFEGPRPQIIGLTASLPLGSGRLNAEAALDRMLQLCARLSAHSITSVRKYTKDLESHVTPPIDEVIRVSNSSDNELTNKLRECMVRIENQVSKELEKIVEEKVLNLRQDEMIFPPQQNSVRYEGFVGSLKARLSEMKAGGSKFQLVKTLDHLGYYYRALCLNDLLPDRFAFLYLKDKLSKERIPEKTQGSSIQEQLKSLFERYIVPFGLTLSLDDKGEAKELLRNLHKILREQYSKEPNSRTLLFVTTRLLAEKLADHLNQARVLGSSRAVGYVTSSNQASAASGQSAEEQRTMIARFNSGSVKVLVATSVAEEGLDISACNLIIKYNNTGSERSLIQRRGRARAKNSRSILLVLDGSVEERELENIQKEQLMRLCLAHIQTKSEEQMKALVNEKLEEEKNMRERHRTQNEERKRMLENKIYNLSCGLCGAFICKSNFMRLACENQYVCCDPTVWERIDIEVSKDAKSFAIATAVGKPHCKGGNGCAVALGTVVKLFGAFLPAFSAKSIVVDDPDDTSIRGHKHKKWENIAKGKFFIDPLTERDLKIMLKSLYKISKEKHDELEVEAQYAVQRALVAMKKERKRRYVIEE